MTHSCPTRRWWRQRLVAWAVVGIWVVLASRLVYVQHLAAPELSERAARQRSYRLPIAARPGEIVDRNGRLLATTVRRKSLYLVPSRVTQRWRTARRVAGALGLNSDRLFERLSRAKEKRFLWVKRRMTPEETRRVRELELPAGTWGFREEFLREYPQGILAAHVLGLRDIDGTGQGGIEQEFDRQLRGRDGFEHAIRDASGRIVQIESAAGRPAVPGKTVALTLDAIVQLFVERELDALMQEHKPGAATAIVLEPRTGEVLAMASRPAFDPNDPGRASEDAWKNHAVASILEPGSTFKPFVIAWALENGVLQRNEKFDCEQGAYRMGRRILHDHHPYGVLDVTDILVKSSNIGMAKIGQRLGNPGLYEAAVTFGFGRPTGIRLPGELDGIVRPLSDWTSYSTGSIPMGQELAVTPLQLIVAHASLANGGRLITPRIVREISQWSPNGPAQTTSPAPVVSRTVSREVAEWIVQGPLREVVERGTGRRAKSARYTVFGKTGTAQKIDPASGTYSERDHVCSFLCGGPVASPRALVLVTVDSPTGPPPHYGGTVAAPAAARILEQTLRHLGVPGGTLAKGNAAEQR